MRLFISFWLYPLAAAGLLLTLPPFAGSFPIWKLALWGGLGLLQWSAIEYLLHRFFFHWAPENRAMRRFLARLHLRHHGSPRDPSQILVRPLYSVPISLALLVGWTLLVGWGATVGLMTGTWAGFLYYEAVHYRIHLSKQGTGLLGLQRRWHFYHHFVDEHYCFGVTTPLWDLVLGTYRSLEGDQSPG